MPYEFAIFILMRLLLLTLLLFFMGNSIAQCNGSIELCNKKFNEVSYLTTHNAFNCSQNNYSFPNQYLSITEQLNLGVRGFMLDVYDLFGNVTVYHGTFLLGSQPLSEILQEFDDFINNNPNEVITIILECNVSSTQIENTFTNANLINKLYAHDLGTPWPTLQEILNDGKNILVFTDTDDALPNQTWYHYMWTNMVETHFSVDDPSSFTHDFNRGDSINDLFIFNHFVTDVTIGIGLENQAIIVNEYSFLMNRIQENYQLKQKFPNFVTLDFVSVGDGMQVVDDLNQNALKTNDILPESLSIYPNPTNSLLNIELPYELGSESIELELQSVDGRINYKESIANSSVISISIDHLPEGIYILKISNDSNYLISDKIVLK